ncbi:beta-mannosidase [Anaerotaenia torta]|uniref:glycosyl hydrolase 2 galactose-binding domain-containing protein n=1 Tax=Anaerotaenia torta TaxID=433293 RepID=UPI003D1BC0A0
MIRKKLSDHWRLRGEFLDVAAADVKEVTEREEGTFGIEFSSKGPIPFPHRCGYLEAVVPGDVVDTLLRHGLMKDPLLKDNSKEALWVKDLSWWYIREFHVEEEMLEKEEVRLFLEQLDYNADIIINHHFVEKHKNTFVSFYQNVKRFLKPGKNQLVIRLTSGVEEFHERDSISFYGMNSNPLCNQRIYLRKPQYTYGWDWCKSLPTCGMGGEMYLEAFSGARIAAFRMDTLKIEGTRAKLRIYFEIEKLRMCQAEEVTLHYSIHDGDRVLYESSREHYFAGGLNFVEEEIELEEIELWWPNGYGSQKLYQVRAYMEYKGEVCRMKEREAGIRTVALDLSKREDGTRNYAVFVNGVKIWCKGGNWVPADSYYLRTPMETYKTLISEAKEANFTMLRMWGGGLYEPDYFYEECSRQGILIMHDFMYACALYPDHLPWFLHQAMLEAEYQTKRLAHYPCMALWTGNNEIHESMAEWFPDQIQPKQFYGAKIFNYIQPKAVRDNSPCIPYVPGSPYFGRLPNDMDAGDSHIWKWMGHAEETKMNFRYELEAFDRLKTRFSSEYGFYGALMHSSVKRYHDGEKLRMGSPVWEHHGEYPRKHQGIMEGIRRHLAEPKENCAGDYLLYSGILQGCLYKDLAETLRSKEYCQGNLIWMYNDCWPETGWTVIDYYLTRKISYYFLKRAYEPKKFLVKRQDGLIRFIIINESGEALSLSLEYGYVRFNGKKSFTQPAEIELAAHARHEFSVPAEHEDFQSGCYYIKALNHPEFTAASEIRPYYRALQLPEAQPEMTITDRTGEYVDVRVVSGTYVPVAYLACEDDRIHYSDNYFELLPNEEKLIRVYQADARITLHQLRIDPE